MGKVKIFAFWFAIFSAGLASAAIYMIFIRLQIVNWVEANCADSGSLVCSIASVFAFNWRVMLIPAVVFVLLGLKYAKPRGSKVKPCKIKP
jgi:hypothetical protein